MATNSIPRHEVKYYITNSEYEVITKRLAPLITLDKNHINDGYLIRSLYFDDMYASALNEKLDGLYQRRKYRIRIYNNDLSKINLECKEKVGKMIIKTSEKISIANVKSMLNQDYSFLVDQGDSENISLFRKKLYARTKTHLLKPSVIVDYNREAYIMDSGTVRLTFDKHIRAGVYSTNLMNSEMTTIQVLPEDLMVFEIKYTNYLPSVIKQLIQSTKAQNCAISKFVMCKNTKRGVELDGKF
jgi:hypothetical protein